MMEYTEVKVWEEDVVIPTYPVGKPDKNPMFFERRVYQGSSGVVYPYPVIEKLHDAREDKVYHAVFLENKCLKIKVLPELGGRVQMAYDRTTKNPGYAAWQHFSEPELWADDTIDSLKSWGFTTIGGWSDVEHLRKSKKMTMPFTLVLHCGITAGAPWLDMWDSTVVKKIDDTAREQILKVNDSPYLLGYYSDNELGWWNAALWKITWEQKPTSGARTRLVKMVRDTCRDDWNAMSKDFEATGAGSFEELNQGGRLYLRPGRNGMQLVNRFVGMIAERYYELTTQIIRKHDPAALTLGDRYQSFYYPEVVRAAGKYLDVVSTNFGVHWSDGSAVRFYLSTMYELSKKPITIGEFYMTAMENRSGNQNSSAAFPTVQTQKERAHGFVTTTTLLAQTPFVVGCDWFQFYDEPMHGREDGENFNMGLVDIHGKRYEELTEASKKLDWHGLKSRPTRKLQDASTGIPPVPSDPLSGGDWKRLLRDWDRDHAFVNPATPFPTADLYVCWSPDTLYLGLYTDDIQETSYYKDGKIPEEDRMTLILNIDGRKEPLRFRLGSGRAPFSDNPDVGVLNVQVHRSKRNITILRIPSKVFGRGTFVAGNKVKFTAVLQTVARAHSVEWKANYALAGKFGSAKP